ncbi:hypothetical protein BJY04DRAFT_175430 [Aspergillus karnatakaensis]|uniref:uncharacterized protein n=1 Tax=Aspergillus karnatakaensis TaxID=1810916 RepID=UPI003CCE250C
MVAISGDPALSTSTLTTDRTTVTLQRSSRGQYVAIHHARLRNNLLAGVGFLELANAGDFAANVWNEIPVPRHAVILMAIGGPIALLVSIVAARDFYLSWKNVSLLYAERKNLLCIQHPNDRISAILGVNTRELGTEIIDRMLMDAFLGFGALLVGTGTIMAIWGADHRVFEASNLLSGFVGNSCAAIFGVINAVWSAYIVYRFHRRYAACRADSTAATRVTKIRQRFRSFQWHAGINGLNGLVAGMASMVTAKMWWGYVVLIPCVAVMIAGNLFWKMKFGYDRPLMTHLRVTSVDEEKGLESRDSCDVLDALVTAEEAQVRLDEISQHGTLETAMEFIVDNDMFYSFCEMAANAWPDHRVFVGQEDMLFISCRDLMSGSQEEIARLALECRRFLDKEARTILTHRERYLLELLGETVYNGGERH